MAATDSLLSRLRARCNSWVMIDDATKGFVPLPREKILFTSPPRTTLSLSTPNKFPGKEPVNVNCSGGIAFITNQRLVYLPTTPTEQLQSFSAPILNLQDTHVSAPFFGPNVWSGILLPVTGGGLPAQHAYVEIKMVFKDGGAFDYHSQYERVKETLSHAIESARESGQISGSSQNIDLSTINTDQLPAYEEVDPPATTPIVQPTPIAPGRVQPQAQHQTHTTPAVRPPPAETSNQGIEQSPNEPPPGYEEAQQDSVANSLEESLRRRS